MHHTRHIHTQYGLAYIVLAPLNKRCSQHYGIIFVHECENCRLVQSHQFVAKLHQNAPNRILNFKKSTDETPGHPHTGGSATRAPGRGMGGKEQGGRKKRRGRREREEEKGLGLWEKGRKGGEGIIHLLLP